MRDDLVFSSKQSGGEDFSIVIQARRHRVDVLASFFVLLFFAPRLLIARVSRDELSTRTCRQTN